MMRYTVIGLGQFGQELCTELSARNIEVVAVASTDEELEQIKDLVTYAVVTDYTMAQLGHACSIAVGTAAAAALED